MARSFPDRGVVAVALLIAGGVSSLLAAVPTLDKKTPIDFKGGEGCFRLNTNAGTLESCDVTLRQGPNTLITAKRATAKGLTGNNNGEWNLTGSVHIEFDNAVLDADSATVTFADDRLQRVHVTGAPSRFSHQLKDTSRRNQGRAATIDYDAQSALLRLSGDTWYSDGSNTIETAAYTYNLNDSSFSTTNQVNATFQPNKRVPPPRTPDRATSQ